MSRRLIAFLAAVAASLLLGGCTAIKLSYNHADDIVRFMASDYFDLDDRQQEIFRAQFAELHHWHRSTELPRYAELLRAASGRVSKGLQRSDMEWATQTLRERYRFAAGRAAREAAPLLATLRPEQIQSIEKKFSKSNSKHVKEWLPGGQSKRDRKLFERTVERIEDWTGRLSATQRQRVEQLVKAHPRIMEIRYAERQRWQAEVVDTLRRHQQQPAELAQRLAKVFTDPESGRSREYLRETERYERDLAQMLLDLDRTFSAEQREQVTKRMHRYAEDFRALAGGRSVAGDPRSAAAPN